MHVHKPMRDVFVARGTAKNKTKQNKKPNPNNFHYSGPATSKNVFCNEAHLFLWFPAFKQKVFLLVLQWHGIVFNHTA